MPARPLPEHGTLASWDDVRGFGFIETPAGRRLFVHISAFDPQGRRPRVGDTVAFELGEGRDGRPRATRALVEGLAEASVEQVDRSGQGRRMPHDDGPAPQRGRRGRPAALPFVLLAAFAVFLVLAVTLWGASPWFAALYLGMSCVAFALYALDKSAAIRGAWRTRENTLHVVALLGGWPGAIVAQQLLRHKSRKVSFQLVFWLLVIVNVGAFTVLLWRPALIDRLTAAMQ